MDRSESSCSESSWISGTVVVRVDDINCARQSETAECWSVETESDHDATSVVLPLESEAEHADGPLLPTLTTENVARCMWSLRQLSQITVTARLVSGARVCLALMCQAPGRPLMTWPGDFTVMSALLSTDWVVEVSNPTAENVAEGTVYRVKNDSGTTYVTKRNRRAMKSKQEGKKARREGEK